jgi:PAN domain
MQATRRPAMRSSMQNMRATSSTGATRCSWCGCAEVRFPDHPVCTSRGGLLGNAQCSAAGAIVIGLQDSADACCDLCKADPRCNIWVFCPLESGCGPGLPHRECWLKHLVAQPPDLAHIPGKRGPGEALVVGNSKHPCTCGPHAPLMGHDAQLQCLWSVCKHEAASVGPSFQSWHCCKASASASTHRGGWTH